MTSNPPLSAAADAAAVPTRGVQRVRHELKRRQLQVLRTRQVTPQLLCVTLAGDDLADFVSASHDDHVKVFIPSSGDAPPAMRDYTPRRFDTSARELDIEFVLHGDGPAASWAGQAQPGQALSIGGPRGSFVVSNDFDWYLLVGDETALPAVARRLEELPASARVTVVLIVDDASAQLPLASAAALDLRWVVRSNAAGVEPQLVSALRGVARPAGDGYAWAAGEASEIAAVRQYLVQAWELDKSRIRAASYWKRGAVGHHETLEG